MCLALVTGCGGSSEGATGSTKAESSTDSAQPTKAEASAAKEQFIKSGDAICARIDTRQAAELKSYWDAHPGAEATKSGQVEAVKAVGLPPISAAVEELRTLSVPDGDAAEVKAILDALEAAVQEAERNPASALGGPKNPFEEASKLAQDYGFVACASPA
jgi:hypothetical protein